MIVSCVSWPPVRTLWENVQSQFLIGFLEVQLCEFFVYFGYEPLFRYTFANIFSHSVGCLFIL